MELLLVDLIRPYAADVLGSAACVATLLTFAQTRMWPMRISAIAANLFFIGYGALELLYPVLFLHLVLLPLNLARLIQLAQNDTSPHTSDPQPPQPVLVPPPLPMAGPPSPCDRGQKPVPAGHPSTRSTIRDVVRPSPAQHHDDEGLRLHVHGLGNPREGRGDSIHAWGARAGAPAEHGGDVRRRVLDPLRPGRETEPQISEASPSSGFVSFPKVRSGMDQSWGRIHSRLESGCS